MEEPTRKIKSILQWIQRAMKTCCGYDLDELIRFCDDPISPWIKITPTTLPEESDIYLVCDRTDPNHPAYVASWFDVERGTFNYSSATHWQPITLPEKG